MVTNGSVRHGEIKCSGYEPNHNCRNQAITLKLVALRKSLRLVIRDVSERSAVQFPNSFDPPVIKLRRFVCEGYVPSQSGANPQSLGRQPCSGCCTKIPTPIPRLVPRRVYGVVDCLASNSH